MKKNFIASCVVAIIINFIPIVMELILNVYVKSQRFLQPKVFLINPDWFLYIFELFSKKITISV